MVEFAGRLQALMDGKEISNYRLHKDIPCAKTSVANWLSGSALPDGESLLKLASYFDVSIDYLVGRDDVPNRKK